MKHVPDIMFMLRRVLKNIINLRHKIKIANEQKNYKYFNEDREGCQLGRIHFANGRLLKFNFLKKKKKKVLIAANLKETFPEILKKYNFVTKKLLPETSN